MKTLYLCGAGNTEGVRLALRVNQAENRWDRIILLDDDPRKHGQLILGVEIAGSFALLDQLDPASNEVANLVSRSAAKRWSSRRKIEDYGLPFASLISPTVDLAEVELSEEVTIYQNATVSPQVTMDEGAVIWMGAAVGQECRLGRCCVVGPHAVVNGRVELEEGVYVGTNATILPEVKVGPWATVGAGSVAFQDVPAGATVLGVPGKIILTLNKKLKLRGSGSLLQALRPELASQVR